jgi:hypothetical protein
MVVLEILKVVKIDPLLNKITTAKKCWMVDSERYSVQLSSDTSL